MTISRRTPLRRVSARREQAARAAGSTFTRPNCGKVRYPTEMAAKLALLKLTGKDDPAREKGEKRHYFHRACKGWHLTSQPGPGTGRPSGERKPGAQTQRAETFPPKVAALIDRRDSADGTRLCVRCGSPRDLHRHHRRLKQAGGDPRPHTHCACNGVTLCSACHHWAHVLDRREAEAEGLIISRSVTEPWMEPVLVHGLDGGAQAFPACAGEWIPEAPAQRREAS